MNKLFPLLGFLLGSWLSHAQHVYLTPEQIGLQLQELANSHPQQVSLETIGHSYGNEPLWLLTLGNQSDEFIPGIAMVAGLDGTHPAGTAMALMMADQLLNGPDSVKALLHNMAFYIIPLVNPDAYRQIHGSPAFERRGNAREMDIDRDGRVSEDPFEDLNDDGLITLVRVADPTGNMTVDEKDPRLMVPLSQRKPGTEIYRLISEGIDNDKDGQFNEDGPGGVEINRNFAFGYEAFAPGTGHFAMSEPESRALADFLFDKWNIYAVFTLGMENTLNHPVKFDAAKVRQRIISGPLEKDAGVADIMSSLYGAVTSMKNAPQMPPTGGSFTNWAYFHYGRFSFATPGWVAPETTTIQDTTAEQTEKTGNRKSRESEDNYDHRYIAWAESVGIHDYFVDWTPIEHPDFPGMRAEVGGFKPWVRYNPPAEYLELPVQEHLAFLVNLSSYWPKLEFQAVRTEKLENQVYRITGRVVNTGYLPTHTQLGDRTRWVRQIRNRVLLAEGQEMLLGIDRTFHGALQPGEAIDFSWLVRGQGQIILEAASPMIGISSVTLHLN